MFKTAPILLTLVLALASSAAAQSPQPAAPAKPGETAAAPAPPRAPSLVNIRLELSIADQRGDALASPKTVMMIVADRESGRIRTGRGNVNLNVDARPELTREGRVRVLLTLEYLPRGSETDKAGEPPLAIVESLTALLEDGKPLVVSQSADPSSDRRVKVELKATVIK